MTDLSKMTIAGARDALRAGELSSVELTQSYLDAIDGAKTLNAYSTNTPGIALAQAKSAEKLGVDLPTIDEWETDARAPRANSIQMMAGLLNVSIMWLLTGDSTGTDHVEQTHARPEGINDALGEIAQLKETLAAALDKLENLQTRLTRRESGYAAAMAALQHIAGVKADAAAVEALLSVPDEDPDDLEALDQVWEEAQVTFGPDPAAGCPQVRDMLANLDQPVNQPTDGNRATAAE